MNDFKIVVGIDGSRSSWGALQWSARHAELSRRSLLVAYLGEAAEHIGNYGFGDDLAEAAIASLTHGHPAVEVQTSVIDGPVVPFLLNAGADADVLVLGRQRDESSLMSLAPFTTELLARCKCPTLLLGDPTQEEKSGATVVVGASDSDGGEAALRFACTEAARTRAHVLAVRSASGEPEQLLLDRFLTRARTEFPDVVVSGVLTAEALRFALARHSSDAALVVLGRPAADDGGPADLAPDTLLAAYSLPCAVAVVGPERHDLSDTPRRAVSVERSEKTRAGRG